MGRFRARKDFGPTIEILRALFNTLMQAYDAVRQRRITDPKTIRIIARQFEAIAESPEANSIFPYSAGRAAKALYNWALDIDMQARDQSSHTISNMDFVEYFSKSFRLTGTEPVSKTSEITTEAIKTTGNIDTVGHVKVKPKAQPDQVDPSLTWTALFELAELAEKQGVKGPKDLSQNLDKYIWDEWEG